MKVAKRLIVEVIAAALVASGAAAQAPQFDAGILDLPQESSAMDSGGEELPPMSNPESSGPMGGGEMSQPMESRMSQPMSDGRTQESSMLAGPPQTSTEPFADDTAPCGGGSPYDMWNAEPALAVTSGTWLNRGIWYSQVDAVTLFRAWEREDMFLSADDPNVQNRAFFPPFGTGIVNTNRELLLPASHPGEDAAVRGTLGRFLFRDDNNRDHSVEFTAYTNGDWNQDVQLESLQPHGLFTTFLVSGNNRDFDASTSQTVLYSSKLNSFELNYRVKRRLGRDQMVMDPNGNWRREASNGFNRDYLIGFRYMQLRETFDWTAQDIVTTGADGRYLINSDNDLFGFQMGEGIEYETGRWSAALNARLGLYVNDASQHSQLNFTSDDTDDFDRRSRENETSFSAETHILGRSHLTPSFSLRAGLEVFFLESVALAPRQINFINQWTNVETGGSPFYMGGSLGFEGYW